MVNERPTPSSPPPSPGEGLQAARYILIAAALGLGGAMVFFGLPLLYAAAVLVVLTIVAAIPPLRASGRRSEAVPSARQVWPETSMKAAVEAFPKATIVLDPAGVVRYVNDLAARLFPATRPGDLFTLTFRWPEFADALERATAGERNSLEFREPGQVFSVYEVWFSPVQAAGGGVGFILISFDDVSDRQAIARMRADFVANASHELRTPLASLTGFIETLLGPARNDPAASERFLNVMLEQARRMRRLIDDLLSLSRVEMRVHSRPTDRIDLAEIVGHVRDALQPVAASNRVEIGLTVPDQEIHVLGDRDELVQLVQNLVENGIRYGASGGRVDVRLSLGAGSRGTARVTVQDYGPGIPAEHLPRLTERFYRADSSTRERGTGLGLAIVKHIVTRHGGRLDVASEPGKGATFTVELPLAATPAVREEKAE